MAGIGFQLRRLASSGTYTGTVGAYATAAAISAGPWIISIVALMFLTWLLHQVLPGDEIRLFSSAVTHVYAFALIFTGPIQIILTRYTADQISLKCPQNIYPSFRGGVMLTTLVAAVVGGVFFLHLVPSPDGFGVYAAALLVLVSCVFVAGVFLSALQKYEGIVVSFAIGYGVGVWAAWQLAQHHGIAGAMAGLVAGHALLFLLLAICIRRELGAGKGPTFGFVPLFFRLPSLALCGLFYNLGIWIDKFLFWWVSQTSVQVKGALFAAPDYDLAIYLSLLSIAPGMAVFILQVETAFAERFHAYFNAVNEGRSLHQILHAKHLLLVSLQEGFIRLLKVQGVTTLLLVVFAHELTHWFQVSFVQVGIFRITLFGAFLLVVFLAMLTVLFYFNDRRGAMLCSGVFLVANAVLSGLTLLQNEAWYGFGFVTAAGLALFIATNRVNHRLEDLEYHTFQVSD
jgi:uncharacterized membrane protein